jgi:2-dehydro-3-deoxyphosphooctonate aldolase (KDO 8-P synthase)
MIKVNRKIKVGRGKPLCLIAGPCVIDSEHESLMVADQLKKVTDSLGLSFIFKSSFDKANRSSRSSYRGVGKSKGLRILEKVKHELSVAVTTDVHEVNQVSEVAQIVDMIQIPALLCRQTDLIVAAGQTKLPVNVKKGQFMAPNDMSNVYGKLEIAGCKQVMFTERGTMFGYNNLIVDMRTFYTMRHGCEAICFDATHSVQYPGGKGFASGGDVRFVEPLARAACGIGIDAIFIETHPDPGNAKCDGPNSVKLSEMSSLLSRLRDVHRLTQTFQVEEDNDDRYYTSNPLHQKRI